MNKKIAIWNSQKPFDVSQAASNYIISIGNLAETWTKFFDVAHYTNIAIIVDENTKIHCLPLFIQKTGLSKFHLIEVKAGELFKNIETCQFIWSQMLNAGLDRKSLCINLGGGVIGDMGGFCAATYKRGIDFIQIPTTLLSQVDSSIGGKLGIDFHGIKNTVGVFQDPKAVFIDTDFLATLSQREIKSGFAEMIKHCLIADSKEWNDFQAIEAVSNVVWANLIYQSLQIKRDIVEKDPFEKNIRKALNFGHTIGHAVESYFLASETPLLHGEAIAIGMVCEAYLSFKICGLPSKDLATIVDYFQRFYIKTFLPKDGFDSLLNIMTQDKKNENNTINFALLSEIGSISINQYADNQLIIESLNFYNKTYKNV
jgi:3-dehydroquinate synthase